MNELLKFPDAQALAQAAASEWLNEVGRAGGHQPPYCVALSGGRIASRFFSAAADVAKAAPVAFHRVHFFWSDERCVPPTDPESNFRLAQENLFQPLGISEAHFHRVQGENPPEIAASQAEAMLRGLAGHGERGQPVLDLVFLGMGEDGHVASLFPGETEEVMGSPPVFRPVLAPKSPARRITLGYPAVVAARQVWVLASGAGKDRALRESLAPAGQTPLARVLKLRPHTKIFTDIL